MKDEIINLHSSKTVIAKHISSDIQADTLFTFTKKLDYLIEWLSNRRLFARYNIEDIDYLGIDNLNKIAYPMKYQTLINKQPIKRNFDINSINVKKEGNDFDALNKFKGGLYFFSFNDNEEFSILGRKLVLPRLVYASNTIITDIQDNGDLYKICFKKDTSTFYGVVYFASENERRDYLKYLNPKTIIEDSKSIDEFIVTN